MDHETIEEQKTLLSSENAEKGSSPFSLFPIKREERGLTTQDIAFYLKVSNRQILDLEQSEFHKLPGKTFIRCLIRSYAQHLHLNPEDFLQYYETHQPPEKHHALSEPVVFISHTPSSFRQPKKLFVKFVAAIIVLNAAILLIHYRSSTLTNKLNPIHTENRSTVLSGNTLLSMSNATNDLPVEILRDALSRKEHPSPENNPQW